jgi:2-oxoglutarate ferredoxin oxidoreductase subunit alpha
MQESLSEITRSELPLVYFNMARGQYDYYQATRGGGHGDYRHLVLAPIDVHEAVELTQLAFDLADRWRNPVQIYGDDLLAHTCEAVEVKRIEFPPLPEKDWAVDGSLGGTGKSRNINPLGMTKGTKGIDPEGFWLRLQAKHDAMQESEARFESEHCEDAEIARYSLDMHAIETISARGFIKGTPGYMAPELAGCGPRRHPRSG